MLCIILAGGRHSHDKPRTLDPRSTPRSFPPPPRAPKHPTASFPDGFFNGSFGVVGRARFRHHFSFRPDQPYTRTGLEGHGITYFYGGHSLIGVGLQPGHWMGCDVGFHLIRIAVLIESDHHYLVSLSIGVPDFLELGAIGEVFPCV